MDDTSQTATAPPTIMPPTTFAIAPARFSESLSFVKDRRIVIALLALMMVVGFALRVNNLSAESLSEDELNKLQTANDYRDNGLSGRNGEHPFLMKGLQTVSLAAAERIGGGRISDEAALRFPLVIAGTLSILLIYLLITALFGRSVGLISAALWAVEPMAIGFDRVAKEDSLVLFFFLLANLLWVKSQTRAELGDRNWLRWSLLAGVAFAALMASKYYPWLLANLAGYYFVFQAIPGQKWALGRPKWLLFFVVMGAAFLAFNPTILFPETWREMLKFSSEGRIGHDAYEYFGTLYPNKLTLWLKGVPWTFYYVFLAVKSSLTTLILFLVGLTVAFRRRMGDGRFLLFFWAVFWFGPFTVLGGKFTRYFTIVEPLVLIIAAIGICFVIDSLRQLIRSKALMMLAEVAAVLAVIAIPLYDSVSASPHFRLFTNALGGGPAAAGSHFPHDEFYDAATRQIAQKLAPVVLPGAQIASETPGLYEYYFSKIGRSDLKFVSLSDRDQLKQMRAGDVIIVVRGRKYFSNSAYLDALAHGTSAVQADLNGIPAAEAYVLDESLASAIVTLALK